MTAAAAVAVSSLASAAYQEAAAALDRRRFPPPGRLVDIGGRRLHLREAGDGSPAVVIVPALGDNVLLWTRIQRELAAEMRVCVYDRAPTRVDPAHCDHGRRPADPRLAPDAG